VVRLSDFDYELPEELIAQTPLPDRAASRLLHLDPETGEIFHRQFREVIDILEQGDVLVLNNTRVNAWRFKGRKSSGGEVEVLALKEIESGVFESLIRPARRLKIGATFTLSNGIIGTVVANGEEAIRIVRLESGDRNLYEALNEVGEVPLPPYITEKLHDSERYQTVFSQEPGSAAAPTAGLHFTQEIIEKLKQKGVTIVNVTLHVGIDTFRPIQVDDVSEHRMHGEVCEILPEAANIINEAKGRIIAVGTTAVRTLESFAMGQRKVSAGRQESRIFITPGYQFQVIDGMFTNFHFPKTTMLLMISALASKDRILQAYGEAIRLKYRFLSFGDSMLLFKSRRF
jgi:S-adenosylmethionine:tRNA ribosyltransferase-isomerase